MNLAVVTLEDRQAVYSLLDRWLDWIPPVRLAVKRGETTTAAGVGRWERCTVCAGTGRLIGEGRLARACRGNHAEWPYAHGCRACPAGCEQGHLRLHGKKAEAGIDPMLNRIVGKETGVDVTSTEQRIAKRRWIDGELVKFAALERQRGDARDQRTVTPSYLGARLPAEASSDELTRAHDAKERQWRTGSYPAVEMALELLAATHPLRFEALRVFVIDQHFEPAPAVRARLDEIVEWIAARIPRPILLPADAQAELDAWKHTLEHGRDKRHAAQRAVRNRQIVELVEEHSWSLRRVGRVFDLSHERVRMIVMEADVQRTAVASGPAA